MITNNTVDAKSARALCTVLLATLLSVAACSTPPAVHRSGADLRPIPAPDLTAAEPAVRQQLAGKLAEVEALLAGTATEETASAEALGELGLLYILYDFLDSAEVCFANAESLTPLDHRWPYLRGYLLQVQGRLSEATDHFDRALELAPDSLQTHLRLGRARLELGELEAARARFERGLELDPEAAAALEGLGKVAEAQSDNAAAAAYFERALALAPEANSLHYALGQSYRRLDRIEEAEAQLALAGEVAVRIPDPLLNSLAEKAQSAHFYLTQAAKAMDNRRWEAANAAWERAIELDPDQIDAYRGSSFCREQLGDREGAIEQLRRALDRGERKPQLLSPALRAEISRLRGGLAVILERDDEAVESFRASLAAVAEQPAVRSKLVNALARQGQAEEALVELNLLLAGNPDEAPALLVQRATLFINLGKKSQALADFERAIELAPDNTVIRQRYAEALEFLGDTATATAQQWKAARAADATGSGVQLHAEDARRLLSEQRFEEAAESLRKALALAPERPDLRFRLAGVLGHLGRYDQAIEEFRQILKTAPNHAGSHRGLVTALILDSRWGATRVQLQAALKQFPRNVKLATLQARLLATSPDLSVRDGAFALELARRINEQHTDLRSRETLALACAETGLFDEAVQIQQGVIAEAEATAPQQLLQRLRAELETFENEQAWSLTSPDELLAGAF